MDDEPPPLEDMSVFERLRLKNSRDKMPQIENKPARQDNVSLVDDSFSFQDKFMLVERKTEEAKKTVESPVPLKKGFLNYSPPKMKSKKKMEASGKQIPLVKARAPGQEIPDFLRVSSPMDQFRQEIQSLLKPTQELVSEVLNNEGIKGGLDDPEIMAAVQDIASDPSAFQKYKNNVKVTSFYSQLGNLMGGKIQKQTKEN